MKERRKEEERNNEVERKQDKTKPRKNGSRKERKKGKAFLCRFFPSQHGGSREEKKWGNLLTPLLRVNIIIEAIIAIVCVAPISIKLV